jgi:tellurite resistance protein
MKKIILAAIVAASAFAGAAQAGTPSAAYQQAVRCRGLATSTGLGAIDTANIDAFLNKEGGSLDAKTRFAAGSKMSNARKEGDQARGAKKDRLLAERASTCSSYSGGASVGTAVNTSN